MLSGNINIEDNDWDSVRQGYAALTRDLERMSLSFGLGGNDFGGGVPKSANDQTVQQDGNYGYQAVTTDMLNDVEERLQAAIDAAIAGMPVVTYPISIANGGTGQTTQQTALDAIAGGVTTDRALVGNGTHVALGRVTRNTLSDGSACSIVGRSANSSGVVADISAGSNDLILGRRSNTVTWAKVAKAEMADASGVSVIGRSSNSTGVTADIAASQVGSILRRGGSTLSFSGNEFNQATFSTSGISTTSQYGRYRFIIYGGGGGGGGYSGGTAIAYLANTSGGATTSALNKYILGGSGAPGAVAVVEMFIDSGVSIGVGIGAGGTAGGSGTNGNDGIESYLDVNGSRIVTVSGGGGGQSNGTAGTSGSVTWDIGSPIGFSMTPNGYNGIFFVGISASAGNGLATSPGKIGPYGIGGYSSISGGAFSSTNGSSGGVIMQWVA